MISETFLGFRLIPLIPSVLSCLSLGAVLDMVGFGVVAVEKSIMIERMSNVWL